MPGAHYTSLANLTDAYLAKGKSRESGRSSRQRAKRHVRSVATWLTEETTRKIRANLEPLAPLCSSAHGMGALL